MLVTLVIEGGEHRELQARLRDDDPPQVGDLIELADRTRIEVTAIEPATGDVAAVIYTKPGGLPSETGQRLA